MTAVEFERVVRAAMDRADLSLSGLARQSGVDRGRWYAWFRGENVPQSRTLTRAAVALGIETDELTAPFGGATARAAPEPGLPACGPGGPGGQTIKGTFTLTDSDVDWSATSCSGTGGYSDIREGLGVVVKNEAGVTIATTNLIGDAQGSSAGRCHYTFSVPVPAADFYAVSVGKRGELTYSKAELEAQGWSVGFTLGGN